MNPRIGVLYLIVGNFHEVLIGELAILWKSPNLKSAIIYSDVIVDGWLICHAAKFKACQFILWTDSTNLMFAKFSRYAVF